MRKLEPKFQTILLKAVWKKINFWKWCKKFDVPEDKNSKSFAYEFGNLYALNEKKLICFFSLHSTVCCKGYVGRILWSISWTRIAKLHFFINLFAVFCDWTETQLLPLDQPDTNLCYDQAILIRSSALCRPYRLPQSRPDGYLAGFCRNLAKTAYLAKTA